jgi:hypothetical protein
MNSKQFLVSWSEWKTASIAAHPPIERNNCRTYYLNPRHEKIEAWMFEHGQVSFDASAAADSRLKVV